MSNTNSLQPLQIWPTVLFRRFWQHASEEHPGIIEHLYQLKSAQSSNIDSGVATAMKPAEGMYEGTLDLFAKTDHPGLKRLIGFLDESVRQAVSMINGKQVPPDHIDVDFRESWYHISNDGGFHDAHYHGSCSWCGIYYIRAGSPPGDKPGTAGNGLSRFYCPIPRGGLADDFGIQYLSQAGSFDVPPTDGMLVLFPSYLLHSGLPYRGEEDRILLAFNTASYLK